MANNKMKVNGDAMLKAVEMLGEALLTKDSKVDYLEGTELYLAKNEIKRLKARIEELEKELEEK